MDGMCELYLRMLRWLWCVLQWWLFGEERRRLTVELRRSPGRKHSLS